MIGVLSFFLACVLSLVVCGICLWRGEQSLSPGLKKIYAFAALFSLLAAGFLLQAILTDNFQYEYVYKYSSRQLNIWYKIAVFWAGQEGSFLFWFCLQALLGVFLQKSGRLEGASFTAYTLVQAVLASFLLLKNPFVLGTVHADGGGLNPLLQDFWMVIHPPVVFAGYALFAVPFALAVGNLLRGRALTGWIDKALPWTIGAWGMLGAGIFMGGYWAYKTLGWGGYWGWDPVENASLVPWLSGGALVHLLLWGRREKAAERLAHLAGIVTFALVLYGTFLTRSGVLGDFSVHAFSDGTSAVWLAGGTFGLGGWGLLLFGLRVGCLPRTKLPESTASREFLLLAAAAVLAAMGGLVFVGMSTPLVTTLLGSPQNVSTSYYNHAILLPVVLLALALALIPQNRKNAGWSQYAGRLLAAFLGVGTCLAYGLTDFLYLAAGAGSAAAAWQHFSLRQTLSAGAGMTHIGTALLIAGVIFSSAAATTSEPLVFAGAQTERSVYGRTLRYEGSQMQPEKMAVLHRFTMAGETIELTTKLNDEGMAVLKTPGILHAWGGDYYLAEQNRSLLMSYKPLVLLVWAGCVLICGGAGLAVWKRRL